MLTYFEERRRVLLSGLYKVRSWYFCGLLVYRRWELLTVCADKALPSEVTP